MLPAANLPNDVLVTVPPNLPVPQDDGACNHLKGLPLPSIALPSTTGCQVNLAREPGWVVIYCYPMTGQPGKALPEGWIATPGAAGCTPQSCGFRDVHLELAELGAKVFGISAQTTEDQKEAAERLELPFALLSDRALDFTRALNLPTFEIAGMRLIKRLTFIAKNGVIEKCFYPVFPPDRNAGDALAWLRYHAM